MSKTQKNQLKIPNHIAIILDGNRRYAEKLGLPKLKGHEHGAKNVGNLFKWCKELEIKEVTLYTFSTENFKRGKEEVDYLMHLFRQYFNNFIKKYSEKNKDYNVKVNIIGKIELFPKDVQKAFKEVMEKTKNNDALTANFCLGYGSKTEIVDALKAIIKDIKNQKIDENSINEDTITQNLYLPSEPDILIRPGGEKRLSNFLLWQCSYAELFFLDKLWPEFTKEDLMNIIKEFNQRERRFGE